MPCEWLKQQKTNLSKSIAKRIVAQRACCQICRLHQWILFCGWVLSQHSSNCHVEYWNVGFVRYSDYSVKKGLSKMEVLWTNLLEFIVFCGPQENPTLCGFSFVLSCPSWLGFVFRWDHQWWCPTKVLIRTRSWVSFPSRRMMRVSWTTNWRRTSCLPW